MSTWYTRANQFEEFFMTQNAALFFCTYWIYLNLWIDDTKVEISLYSGF